ncbi:MAG: hypothetical protein Q8O55_08865 [Dehalococcoidales bacterium]|nr:hypothetical protein [Dehalococcoidales bacterium]
MVKVSTFKYQFPGMRKPDDIIVYPNPDGKVYTFQGDRTIGTVDVETRKGVLNFKGSNSKYFIHLNKVLGAVDYNFPQEFVNLIKEFSTKKGDIIGPGIILG